MRVYDGRPFRLAQHLARLQGSAERIGLERPDADEFEALAALALERAAAPEAVLRLYWTPGPPGGEHRAIVLVGADPRLDRGVPGRGVSDSSRCSTPAARRRGSSRRRSRRATPSASRPRPRRRREVRTTPCSSTPTPSCSRGPVTNIWWREGDVLLTPSLEAGILAGETRAALLELGSWRGPGRRGGASTRSSGCSRADEVFTSSSVREVMPVVVAGRSSARARPGGSGAAGGTARRGAPVARRRRLALVAV